MQAAGLAKEVVDVRLLAHHDMVSDPDADCSRVRYPAFIVLLLAENTMDSIPKRLTVVVPMLEPELCTECVPFTFVCRNWQFCCNICAQCRC